MLDSPRSSDSSAKRRARAPAEKIRPQTIDLDTARDHPTDILKELADRGYAGLTVAERYGGRGDGPVELAAALMPVASALALHLGVVEVIERFGTDDQRDQYLPAMADFETVGVLGLSEANAGSNKLQMETTAEREGDDWVLSGHNQWLTNFNHGDYVLTYAKTGPEEQSPHNITAFLVPTDAFDVERHLRDAKLLTIAGDPNEGHKDTLAEAVYAKHPR